MAQAGMSSSKARGVSAIQQMGVFRRESFKRKGEIRVTMGPVLDQVFAINPLFLISL